MNNSVRAAVLGVVIAGILAGCVTVPKGEEVDIHYDGSINGANEEFRMDGYVSSGGGIPDQETYRNISIKLYSKDGTLLCEDDVGTLQAHDRRNVSVTADIVPEYVIITSPDFWDEQVEVDYFQRNPNREGYDREEATSKEDLPVSMDSSIGESCST